MTIPAAAGWGRVARWMLLLSTLVGLATMHTLGHTAAHMDPHGHAPAVLGPALTMAQAGARTDAAVTAPAVHAAVPAHCPDDGCGRHQHGGMTGWGICLAVLSGLAMAVLLAASLLRRAGPRARRGDPQRSDSGIPRPPPTLRPGALLASMAVLRI